MADDLESREELDFSRRTNLRSCPYCGETLSSDELGEYTDAQTNTFVCPNCRKKLNIHELSAGI